MANKCLGQAKPSTLTALYTCPDARSAVISTLSCCNTGASTAKVRVSHAIEGAADTLSQYVFYDMAIAGNSTRMFTVGACLAETDVLRVMSDTGQVAFTAWGSEQ